MCIRDRSYSIATGQSSSASETLGEILATGNSETSVETPLAWDSPIDAKTYLIFIQNNKTGLFGKSWLNKMTLYTEAIYRSGKRYTPYELTGYESASGSCLLYTSDAADERSSVDLGGRRIIKKKKK